MSEIAHHWRLLRALLGAELAAGILGLKIFVASVTVATLVVGSVWLMGDGLTGALKRGGTVFLGADVAVTVANVPLASSLQTQLGEIGQLSRVAELRTSARVNGRRATVELKAVDDRYPLHGAVRLESGGSLEKVPRPPGASAGATGVVSSRACCAGPAPTQAAMRSATRRSPRSDSRMLLPGARATPVRGRRQKGPPPGCSWDRRAPETGIISPARGRLPLSAAGCR